MKSKTELLNALARNSADRVLLANLLDKERACAERSYLTCTRFLDGHERALCTEAVCLLGASAHSLFWGGYDDAERVVCVFYPDYLNAAAAQAQVPMALLRAHTRRGATLTHRDYLGALMGLQIERAMIGDILLHDEGADIFVMDELADFLTMNFTQAGRCSLEVTRETIGTERRAAADWKEGSGSVASPRLDILLALAFGLSRTKAQTYIAKGAVLVNHLSCLKPDHCLSEGDRITVRGLGRAEILTYTGKSRKGRTFVDFRRTK